MPNLLLAFGLLGTFLGITINLSTLSQTINQTDASDISNLVAELKKPLEGMSIAFTTSLTGLFFSALLTVINFFYNSGLAKYRLLSSLEDYLDNIYLPKIQGDNRLDKIVNKMVSQQDEFLTRFGDPVREAVENGINVVEIIGHTDAAPNGKVTSDLDVNLEKVVSGTFPVTKLQSGSNADLGLMRALSVVKILRDIQNKQSRLKGLSFRAYSAAQLILPNGQLAEVAPKEDEKKDETRRRIEIRFTRLGEEQEVGKK